MLLLWLSPSVLFLLGFVIAKRVSGTGLRLADPAVIAWGVLGPTLMLRWPHSLESLTGLSLNGYGLIAAVLFIVPPSLVTALLLGAATRSWIVVGFTLAAGVISPFVAVLLPFMHLPAMIGWNIIVAGGLLVWANGVREARAKPGRCVCGYLIAGLETPVCPECGGEIVVAAAGPARA